MPAEVSTATPAITTVVKEQTPAFALSAGVQLAPVQDRPKLTLSRMQIAVDAIESGEARANAVLQTATRSFGKDGSSTLTRVFDGPLPWVALLGIPVLAGFGAYQLLGGFSCVVGTVVAAASAFVATGYTVDRVEASTKRTMARATLEPQHLQSFAALHEAASERALERAAIGRVARASIATIKDREIYHSAETAELLERIAQDDKLGDAAAQAELERHRSLIVAFRGLAAWKHDLDACATALIDAFRALTPEERTAIAPELKDKLFVGAVPRGDGLGYARANELREALARP